MYWWLASSMRLPRASKPSTARRAAGESSTAVIVSMEIRRSRWAVSSS
jgi:hypothetical protein